MERLEKVQYRAALAVTGCWQGTNRNKLYDELGWETLAHRGWARRLIYLFKIIHSKSPAYLYELIPHRRIPVYGKYRNSFFPDSIKAWNNLTEDLRTCKSISMFKKKITSLIKPPTKSIFEIYDPLGIKNIF